jgi:hypothetical protein
MSTAEFIDNFSPIANAASAVGVPIHPDVTTMARTDLRNEHDFVFSKCHAAFTQAARILRRRSNPQLIADDATNSLLPSYVAVDGTGEQFVDMFNSAAGDEYFCREDVMFEPGPVADADYCGFAEIAFADTVSGLLDKAEQTVEDGDIVDGKGYTIFTGADDRPVLIRKSIGIPTSLSLEPIMINGVLYPAGSIVRATTKKEAYLENLVMDMQFTMPEENVARAIPVSEIGNIGIMRLSLFAAPDDERGKLAKNDHTSAGMSWLDAYNDKGAKDVLDKFHIVEARQRAMQALDILETAI